MIRSAMLASATAVALSLLAMSGSANAASFNCSKSGLTYTEASVCDNGRTSHLDSVMARGYFRDLRHTYGWERHRIIANQINWLHDRNACGADVRCLNQLYKARIQDLHQLY
jgi:uncharacterized protein